MMKAGELDLMLLQELQNALTVLGHDKKTTSLFGLVVMVVLWVLQREVFEVDEEK